MTGRQHVPKYLLPPRALSVFSSGHAPVVLRFAAQRRAVLAAAMLISAISVATSAAAQNLPVRGSDATFDVATWNIYFFGDDTQPPEDDLQIANAVEVIRQSDVDLWSIQEIQDPSDFDRLVDALGDGWTGELLQRASSNLHIAFIYKTAVVTVEQIGSVLSQYAHEFAGRLPIQMRAQITMPDTTFTGLFIGLHMKCCSDVASWERRQEASQRLKAHLDVFFPHMPIFVLGDFNDELTQSITSGRPSPYQNFVEDPDNYRFVTQDLVDGGKHTFCFNNACSSGSAIDHILISDELFDAYVGGSADPYDAVLDPEHGIEDYRSSTSDHLPVLAHFNFTQVTGTETPIEEPAGEVTIHPNPTSYSATLTIGAFLSAADVVQIDITDVLGRSVKRVERVASSGSSQTLPVDVSALPSGTYILHVRTNGYSASKPFVVIRQGR